MAYEFAFSRVYLLNTRVGIFLIPFLLKLNAGLKHESTHGAVTTYFLNPSVHSLTIHL